LQNMQQQANMGGNELGNPNQRQTNGQGQTPSI